MNQQASPDRGTPAGAERAFHLEPALAYVRALRPELVARAAAPAHAVAAGRAAGLPLQRFKRSAELPRVAQVLGVLRGLAPRSLLDIGSGRGVFLWPLLEALPQLPVLSAELSPERLELLGAVRRGGLSRLAPLRADVRALPLSDRSVDVATCLEVLEHLHHPAPAAVELLRVARRFAVVSVPSHPDDNPQHVQLFSRDALEALLRDAGARRVAVSFVRGHMVAVATCPGDGEPPGGAGAR